MVDEAAEPFAALNPAGGGAWRRVRWFGGEAAVGALGVVVVELLGHDAVEMSVNGQAVAGNDAAALRTRTRPLAAPEAVNADSDKVQRHLTRSYGTLPRDEPARHCVGHVRLPPPSFGRADPDPDRAETELLLDRVLEALDIDISARNRAVALKRMVQKPQAPLKEVDADGGDPRFARRQDRRRKAT